MLYLPGVPAGFISKVWRKKSKPKGSQIVDTASPITLI